MEDNFIAGLVHSGAMVSNTDEISRTQAQSYHLPKRVRALLNIYMLQRDSVMRLNNQENVNIEIDKS